MEWGEMETDVSFINRKLDVHDTIYKRKIIFQVGNTKYSGWLQSITKLGALIATKHAPQNFKGREIVINVLNTKNEAIDQKARVEWAGKKILVLNSSNLDAVIHCLHD
jgi:hypothetical protein